MILRNELFREYKSEFMRIKPHLLNLEDDEYVAVIDSHKRYCFHTHVLFAICLGWRYGKGKSINRDIFTLIEMCHNL